MGVKKMNKKVWETPKVKLQEKAADVTKDVLRSGTGDSFPGTEEILAS